jgi:hypothetical protein
VWTSFLFAALLSLAAGLGSAFGFVLLVDPYGVSPVRALSTEYLVRTQRRFIVPQIVRSGRYDSYIVGTSTVNSIDPEWLERALGGRFANVAVHGATPYEQMRVLGLVLRQRPAPRLVVLGLDEIWCRAESPPRYHPQARLPEWLFEDDWWRPLVHLLNWRAVEFAWRKLEIAAGRSNARIAANGFHDDLPPEAAWSREQAMPRLLDPVAARRGQSSDAEAFPAIDLLTTTLRMRQQGTRMVAVFMPAYAGGGSSEPVSARCKQEVARQVAQSGGLTVDFMYPSSWTTKPENYWDRQHFRQPIAAMIPQRLRQALGGRLQADDGVYRVLD